MMHANGTRRIQFRNTGGIQRSSGVADAMVAAHLQQACQAVRAINRTDDCPHDRTPLC
jgi:hypothetical protein